jgi:hypothetical protein
MRVEKDIEEKKLHSLGLENTQEAFFLPCHRLGEILCVLIPWIPMTPDDRTDADLKQEWQEEQSRFMAGAADVAISILKAASF